MYRKISGSFDAEGLSPVIFLPGFKVWFRNNVVTVAKNPAVTGSPWPASSRQRRIHQALDEKNLLLLQSVVPQISPREIKSSRLVMDITAAAVPGCENWSFEFDSGLMKIFDNRGFELEFSGDRERTGFFMFRGKGLQGCRVLEGEWHIEEKEGIFSCIENTAAATGSIPTGLAAWEQAADKKYAWWHEAFLLTRHLSDLEESKRLELLLSVHQLLMYPEEDFCFDGNFSSWCQGMRKLHFSELLKTRMLKICRNTPVWNYHAKCLTGIDDGIRLAGRCDGQGNPLELDWLIALDSSYSALTAVEMFDYCNSMHDLDFLKEHALSFMKQVMQVIELSIVPENFTLVLPRSPLPGGRPDSLCSVGRNTDRQLFFIHALAERLIKAGGMIGRRPDPVWRDIIERLPRARGSWLLAPDTSWGKAGKKICDMMN